MTIMGTIFVSHLTHDYSQTYHDDGFKPAKVVEDHIKAALDDGGHGHWITISNDTSFEIEYDDCRTDDITMACVNNKFRKEFLDGHSDTASDFNLLLILDPEVEAGPNGVGTLDDPDEGEAACTVRGAELIAEYEGEAERTGEINDDTDGRIRAAVHEVGHNFGMIHDDGLRYYEGVADEIRATPMGCDAGDTNTCGEQCTSFDTEKWDHYYSDCENMRIEL